MILLNKFSFSGLKEWLPPIFCWALPRDWACTTAVSVIMHQDRFVYFVQCFTGKPKTHWFHHKQLPWKHKISGPMINTIRCFRQMIWNYLMRNEIFNLKIKMFQKKAKIVLLVCRKTFIFVLRTLKSFFSKKKSKFNLIIFCKSIEFNKTKLWIDNPLGASFHNFQSIKLLSL